jgi:catechol 2,3-dioxygenase-like lactoylglutathione lyase family enzyme
MAQGSGHQSVFLEAAPFLLVDDVVKAADYYRDKLGFEVGRFFGEPPGFVIVRRNTARVMLRQASTKPALLSNASKMPHALDLYIWVADVGGLAEELKKRGARIVNEPELEDGRREMLVHDLDGYLICFGEVQNWPH